MARRKRPGAQTGRFAYQIPGPTISGNRGRRDAGAVEGAFPRRRDKAPAFVYAIHASYRGPSSTSFSRQSHTALDLLTGRRLPSPLIYGEREIVASPQLGKRVDPSVCLRAAFIQGGRKAGDLRSTDWPAMALPSRHEIDLAQGISDVYGRDGRVGLRVARVSGFRGEGEADIPVCLQRALSPSLQVESPRRPGRPRAHRVTAGRNVRIAPKARLPGWPGHSNSVKALT